MRLGRILQRFRRAFQPGAGSYRPTDHTAESSFEVAVVDWFEDEYGADAVETQAYLPGPGWFCDIRVDTEWGVLYVEVENDADSIRPGTAQARSYAATDPARGVPLVVTPAGHIDGDRSRFLRDGPALVREFDAAAGEWVFPY